MLVHRLQSEKICFNPGSSFVNNLWNCDLFWLLPDSPSGVSIFFCPETKSANASDIEKDRLLALADKVPLSNIEKLSKQKIYIPNTLMEIVLYAIDSALQTHWKSCLSTEDQLSVNDRVL